MLAALPSALRPSLASSIFKEDCHERHPDHRHQDHLLLFGTVAFGKIFNCPKHCLYKAGFVGAVGFGVYIILLSGFGVSSMLSNFAGTVALSICSELFARWYKEPVPVFSIPGVIPLVPGLPLYRAMNYTMQNGYSMGMHTFVSAALDATAIAMGILLISGLAKVYKTSKRLVSKKVHHHSERL